jgi:hypothetical protein
MPIPFHRGIVHTVSVPFLVVDPVNRERNAEQEPRPHEVAYESHFITSEKRSVLFMFASLSEYYHPVVDAELEMFVDLFLGDRRRLEVNQERFVAFCAYTRRPGRKNWKHKIGCKFERMGNAIAAMRTIQERYTHERLGELGVVFHSVLLSNNSARNAQSNRIHAFFNSRNSSYVVFIP